MTASFGSIPHAELVKSVTRRIVDRRVLHLIKMWLECPVEETDNRGRKTRTTEARDNRRGIPQGSCASSTRSGDARAGRIHSRTFTGTSGSCACAGLGTTCRG